VQVLFRYALAIFKHLEGALLAQTDYMSVFNTLRAEVERLNDVKKLTQVNTEYTSCSIYLVVNVLMLLLYASNRKLGIKSCQKQSVDLREIKYHSS